MGKIGKNGGHKEEKKGEELDKIGFYLLYFPTEQDFSRIQAAIT